MNKTLSYILCFVLCVLSFTFFSCDPEARWETENVDITISVKTVSAGFIECSFTTSKEAYFLIAIEEVRDDFNPLAHQKQFMMLALDSANREYINWRHDLLKDGEFNVAPFASHSLQYGSTDHFFTGLLPNVEYWIYAFVVDPSTLKPCGRLHLLRVQTTGESIMDVHFEYRVKGVWDYIYPMDSTGNVFGQFPYIATTRDSLELVEEAANNELVTDPNTYFTIWMFERFLSPEKADIFYGVKAVENDGVGSHLFFREGHTYYTGIGGFDGSFKQMTIYKFKWEGPETELYFHDTDSTNLAIKGGW